jgi:hypothetical protein
MIRSTTKPPPIIASRRPVFERFPAVITSNFFDGTPIKDKPPGTYVFVWALFFQALKIAVRSVCGHHARE